MKKSGRKILRIKDEHSDAGLNIALDTLSLGKQAIFFVNTKRGAEALAEKIALKVKESSATLQELSETALNILPRPTKQCQRLALVLKKGIAFHHAGLHGQQRELIEEGFRKRNIRIICATPTLAQGVDLPAFRVIIKDLLRYGRRGMDYIPVLEYEQMAGRAGRPGMEEYGEAIIISQTDSEKEKLVEKYIMGEPEEILSKLAVEPVLRMYILVLIASDFVNSRKSLNEFFQKTFYAHQFQDLATLQRILGKITALLDEWEFLKIHGAVEQEDDFVSAESYHKELLQKDDARLEATLLGRRVSELYLDPLSANYILTCLRKATSATGIITEFSFLFMISRCNELMPYLKVKMAESDEINEKLVSHDQELLEQEPGTHSDEFEDYLNSFKTALFFEEWINEKDEDYLLEKYSIRPGEINAKLELADWLLFCTEELCRLLKYHMMINEVGKLRIRLKYGAKEELLALLRLRNIGRVRARILFKNKIKTLSDVREADITTLGQLLGKNIAIDIKKQVGQDYSAEKIKVKENKRKGQINLMDYDGEE
ncbi:MAG: helicase-related protein [Nanoarchaeota archaeon]